MSQPDSVQRYCRLDSVQRYCRLELWATKKNLGDEIYALTTHAIHAQALLHIASHMETKNPWLDILLLQLQHLVHDADVMLNELDYFCVKDELRCVDVLPKGCIDRLHFHARQVARVAAAKLKHFSSLHDLASISPSPACFVGNEQQVQDVKTPKPKFNRVLLSTKMTETVEKLKSLTAKVTTLISLGSKG